MGGRGSKGGDGYTPPGKETTQAAKNYLPYAPGQITRYEAGTIYRAVKQGDIKAKPETVMELYGQTDAYIRFANARYNQDYLYYDRIYDATRSILNNDYKWAQRQITLWEEDNIRRSTKKSKWHKYKKDE